MTNKVLLIDGHSILSRAFYGMPMLTTSKGTHTNAVYGFLHIMLKAIEDEGADHLLVAFDLERQKLFRTKRYSEYKGNRKPMPQELLEQVPLMQDMLRAMNIPILSLEGYEADDILGTVAKRAQKEGYEVTVLSGDRDLLQLSDEHIKISIPKTSKGRTEVFSYLPEDVKAEYGVSPLEFIDVKGLQGDTSDNIPGVPGIGEKGARAIIEAYGSIENAYAHADEIKPVRYGNALKEHFDMAQLSKELATICLEAPVAFALKDAKIGSLYTKEALELCRSFEFKSLIQRFALAETAEPLMESAAPKAIKLVTDPFLAGIVYRDAKDLKEIGFSLYADKSLLDVVKKDAHNAEGEALGKADGRLLCGICLSKERCYVIRSGAEYPASKLLEDLSLLMETLSKNHTAVYTLNLKASLKLLRTRRNRSMHDLSVAAYLLNPLKDSYDYEDLARDYMQAGIEGRAELLGKEMPLAAAFSLDAEKEAQSKKAVAYEAFVALYAAKPVFKALKESASLKLYEDIEQPLIFSLKDMEEAGIQVDRRALSDYAALLKGQIEAIEAEIYTDAGEQFNINSPSQLGVVLFEHLGLKGAKKTKTGYSTAADVLNKLAPDYPIVEKVLRYRMLTKLHSTYAAGLDAYIREDGRIHGTFNQTITATGRISSTDPNLQNIPVRTTEGRELRKVFVPREGYVFVDADYSQVELRILAALSGDEKLIGAYRDAVDIHTLTASEVFHIPLSEVTPEMRRNAKAVNFGIVYGISAFGLGEGLSIGRKEAQEYIDKYFETYPKVKEYLDGEVAFAKEHGYVKTLFGRVRPVPEIKSSNFMQRSFGERIAMNSPIQGTAADIMKIGMNRVNMALSGMDMDGNQTGRQYRSRIVLQVHDELLIETHPEELSEVMALVKEHMEAAAELSVKLLAEVNEGANWYECH